MYNISLKLSGFTAKKLFLQLVKIKTNLEIVFNNTGNC